MAQLNATPAGRPGPTRRAVVGGLAAIPCAAAAPTAFGAAPSPAGASRLGWPDGLGLDGAFGAGAVRLPSVGALRDHLAAGLVDVALLPRSTPGVAPSGPAPSLPSAEAWLLIGPAGLAAALPVARPAADPEADSALLALWREVGPGGPPALLALPPGPARANVAAGRLAAALLFGPEGPVPDGCRLLRLGRRAALRPDLGFARAVFAVA